MRNRIEFDTHMGYYLADKGVGSSWLRYIMHSPADFWHAVKSRHGTPATDFGEAVHTLILEPHLFDDLYAIQPEDWGPRNAGEGKKLWDAFKKEHAGKTFFGYEDRLRLERIKQSALSHAGLQEILKGATFEVSAYCATEHEGWDLKSRSDILDKNSVIWDVKTTTKGVDDEAIARTIYNMGYHFQIAHHSHVLAQNDYKASGAGWIFIDTDGPAANIVIRRASARLLQAGQRDFEFAHKRLMECSMRNEWPGYSEIVSEIDLPTYAERWYA